MMSTRREQVFELVRQQGVLRPKDLVERGIDRKYLTLLTREGGLQRIGRGMYVLADHAPSEHHTLAEASRRVASGVICLLSALRYHDLTTQSPFEVWMAIEEKAWQPQVDYPLMRFVRFSGKSWEYGVQEHTIEGVRTRIYSPAKTVADCFKYRNKVGLDIAVEALRDAWSERAVNMNDLWRAADATRMKNVMRPYLESLT